MRDPSRSRLRRSIDVAIPVLVGLFLVSLVESVQGLSPALTVLRVVVGAAQGAALWWRRSRPVLVMSIALAGGVVIQLVAPEGVFPVAGLFAIYALASLRPPRVTLPALAGLLGVTALGYLTEKTEDVTFAMIFPVVVWALGEAARSRRAAIGEAARRAAGEEQSRIARELHDVIAHSVSVIVVQAAAADEVFDEHPDQARRALRSIEESGRGALAELRRLLAAVRPGEEGPALRPQPGLERLPELAGSLRAAGLEVALDQEGLQSASLPAGVDLSAYRIVQEALTNTLRHAGAGRAEVTLRAAHGVLELDVLDDGRGGGARGEQGTGHGIAGMRERATTLGGTLEAGPLPEGGFRVHARLPLGAAR